MKKLITAKRFYGFYHAKRPEETASTVEFVRNMPGNGCLGINENTRCLNKKKCFIKHVTLLNSRSWEAANFHPIAYLK